MLVWVSPSAAKAVLAVEPQMSRSASRPRGRGPVEEARAQGRPKEVECGPTSWWWQMEAEKMLQERAEEVKGGGRETPSEEGSGQLQGAKVAPEEQEDC